MNKVYSIVFYKTIQFYVSLVPVVVFLLSIIDFINKGVEIKFLFLFGIVFFFIFLTVYILWCNSIWITIGINEHQMTIKSPIFKSNIQWQDIVELRYMIVGYAGYALCIKEKNKVHWIPDTFENFDELIQILQKMTSKKVIGYRS